LNHVPNCGMTRIAREINQLKRFAPEANLGAARAWKLGVCWFPFKMASFKAVLSNVSPDTIRRSLKNV
jgi:hypothetical protein